MSGTAGPSNPSAAERAVRVREYARAGAVVAVAALVCLTLRSHLQTTDVAMLLLLSVVFAASRYRQGPALAAAALSIVLFDFLFVPPYYTFAVHDTAYGLTFAVMFAVAAVMGKLTARIREQAEETRERERQTAALYALSRALAEAPDRQGQVALTARHLGQAAGAEAAAVLIDEVGLDGDTPRWPQGGIFEDVAVRVAATCAYQRGEVAGAGTAYGAQAEALLVPLKTPTKVVGVAAIRLDPGQVPDSATRQTLVALGEQAAVALERTTLAERHEQARVEVETERLRTALLSSLSHDLRTPLGSIEGAASTLVQDAGALPAEVRRELAESILDESRRMTRLVSNLLDMVRVESGALAVQKAWQPLEEALGVALIRLDERLRQHPVETRLPVDLPLVPIDELLIEQVFINLLENAVKYTPAGTPVRIAAWRENNSVTVEVADQGPGVPVGSEELIFRKFYRVAGGEPTAGAGLGLTICRGIIAAHGGHIWVERGAGSGTAFRFTLPLEGPPVPELPAELPER